MSEEREISGEVEYKSVKTKAVVILDELFCTSCGECYDIDNVEMTEDENDDSCVLALCPDCDDVLAKFVKE